jgi:hypothetical protein
MIRWLSPDNHLATIELIDNHCSNSPWTTDQYHQFFAQRNAVGNVFEIDGKIAGFVLYTVYKDRFHIHHWSADSNIFDKNVICRMLIDKIKHWLSPTTRTHVTATLNEREVQDQVFLRSCGFNACEIIDRYLGDNDGYVMRFVCPGVEIANLNSHVTTNQHCFSRHFRSKPIPAGESVPDSFTARHVTRRESTKDGPPFGKE